MEEEKKPIRLLLHLFSPASGHYDLYLNTTTCCVWPVNKVRDVIMIIWKQITCSIEKIVRSSVQKTCVKMNDFPSQCNFLYVYKLSSETLKNASDYWKPPVRLGMWIFSSITWRIQKTITGGKNFWVQYIMSYLLRVKQYFTVTKSSNAFNCLICKLEGLDDH